MPKISIVGVLTNVQILIHTMFHGTKVGVDHLGNTYYRGKPRKGTKRERRWVIYQDKPEASLVPAEWHGWLHHQTDAVPAAENKHRREWQKPHLPNQTGTEAAYRPPGHALMGGQRAASTADYSAWTPPE